MPASQDASHGLNVESLYRLTPAQGRAVQSRDPDLVVVAGAGSGKTRTLVARYLHLLAVGHPPPSVAAITFTEKAARGMRNRVRESLSELREREADAEARARWGALEAHIEGARIGTIHSLCAEIVRSHPAETRVDPLFEVADENLSATLRARAAREALNWAVVQPMLAPLFQLLAPDQLLDLLNFLLARRLDSAAPMAEPARTALENEAALRRTLEAVMAAAELAAPIEELRTWQQRGSLEDLAGPALAAQIDELLAAWSSAASALAAGHHLEAAAHLFAARHDHARLNLGRSGLPKDRLREWRDAYDARIDPWLGGARSSDTSPDPVLETAHTEAVHLLALPYHQAVQRYRVALEERRLLDFDDLESFTQDLLSLEEIRKFWQAQINAVLVDEFQDTNRRQQEIVRALSGGSHAQLFVVGDAMQSIYRFRGADVAGFMSLQQSARQVLTLETTFRAHPDLLKTLEALLAPVVSDGDGLQDTPTPELIRLHAHRRGPEAWTRRPYVSFLIGLGENAEQGRAVAADGLARHLRQLWKDGQIQAWEEIALLFRASTGFQPYEDALEASGIPFVTVAGRGFYDRPEIRDAVNLLRAIADPVDDLAMAGALRSPAFGLSDEALFLLRHDRDGIRPLRQALSGDLTGLSEGDQRSARRALEILEDVDRWVDRLPVAELLKRLIDRSDYRAGLATTGARLWQNLDKLLQDAQASGLVRVHDFLAHLDTLRDVSAREGEAPVDAEGAVQLMTVHKAKGLEFPIVILADAARSSPAWGEPAYLTPGPRMALRLVRPVSPLAYQLAQWGDRQASTAEENRLLYVALTRARERAIISGHMSGRPGRRRALGWLGQLLESAGIDPTSLGTGAENQEMQTIELEQGLQVGLRTVSDLPPPEAIESALEPAEPMKTVGIPLYRPLPIRSTAGEGPPDREETSLEEPGEAETTVGRLVHRALQRWLFPHDPRLEALFRTTLEEARVLEAAEHRGAASRARELLERFRTSALKARIEAASERHHEVPYTLRRPDGSAQSGVIDLLFRDQAGWHLVDFKTGALQDAEARSGAVHAHQRQMARYRQAASELLGTPVAVWLCFLDDQGAVTTIDLEGSP